MDLRKTFFSLLRKMRKLCYFNIDKMRVGVIGIGVVGGAVAKSFRTHDIDLVTYDKFKNIGNFEDMLTTDIVFLCLPTLYSYESQSYDKTALHEICDLLVKNNYQGLVVIKSTVEPTTSQNFADKYKLNIFHNPEFLTARTAFEDFHTQSHIIVGKTNLISDEQVDLLVNFFKTYYPDAKYSLCNSTESEMTKISCNCFYSVKIQFFNELYMLCSNLGVNYDKVKDMMIKNNWINPMHTSVPGQDGKLSYGGMCFPKDTNALCSFMKERNVPHKVLESTIEERNDIRGKDNN